jgi:hypothetical protein
MAANSDAQRTYSPTNKEIPIKISPQMFRKSTIPTSVGEEASQKKKSEKIHVDPNK